MLCFELIIVSRSQTSLEHQIVLVPSVALQRGCSVMLFVYTLCFSTQFIPGECKIKMKNHGILYEIFFVNHVINCYGYCVMLYCYREDRPHTKPDGCRLHGTLTVNKVAGNFHITAGK
jgi:hypothetical protein